MSEVTDYWTRLGSAVTKLNSECSQLAAHHQQMLQLNLALTTLIDEFSRVHRNFRNAASGKPQKRSSNVKWATMLKLWYPSNLLSSMIYSLLATLWCTWGYCLFHFVFIIDRLISVILLIYWNIHSVVLYMTNNLMWQYILYCQKEKGAEGGQLFLSWRLKLLPWPQQVKE